MDWITDFAAWLKDLLLFVPRYLWQQITDSLASLIERIPVPDFVIQAKLNFSNLPTDMLYYMDVLQIPLGMSFIISALLLRFILRRIPIIG
jgi:hypothetical protein